MNAKEFNQLLTGLDACKDAVKWARGKDLKTVWNTCERADWMLWLCAKMIGEKGWPTHKQVVLAVCDCAETALKYVKPGEDSPRVAIETARRWAHGKATLDEVRAATDAPAAAAAYAAASAVASSAAYVAAWAASIYAAASYAASSAASSAVYAAAWAGAAYAAASYAAASAAYAAAWAGAAGSSKNASLKQMADLIREQLRPKSCEEGAQ